MKIDVEDYVQTVEVSIGLWTKFAKNSVENVQNVKAFTCFLIIFHILYHRDDKYTSCPLLNDLYKYKALLKNRSAFCIKLAYFLKKSTIWSKASSSLLVNAEGAAVVGATGSGTGGATSKLAVVDLI